MDVPAGNEFAASLATALYAAEWPLASKLHRECIGKLDARVLAAVDDIEARRLHAGLGYRLVPDYPLWLSELIDDVRHAWADRTARSLGAGGFAVAAVELLSGNPMGIATAWESAEGMRDDAKYSRVSGLSIHSFDFPDERRVSAVAAREVTFVCPCGAALTRELGDAGDRVRCGCGSVATVPVPSLFRVQTLQREERERSQGLTRCKVCGARVQQAKGPVQAAGYCTKTCALAHGQSLPEPADDVPAGIEVVCFCGGRVRAAEAQIGKLVPCPRCGKQHTVPKPRGAARVAPVECPKCKRRSRGGSATCQYCGSGIR